MKKFNYIIAFFIFAFIGNLKVDALITCEYIDDNQGLFSFNLTTTTDEPSISYSIDTMNGEWDDTKDLAPILNEKIIRNWQNEQYFTDKFGDSLSEDQKKDMPHLFGWRFSLAEKCPQYLIVSRTQKYIIDIFLSDEENKEKYIYAINLFRTTGVYTIDNGYPKSVKLFKETKEKEQNPGAISCLDYTKKADCKDSQYFSCMWNKVNIDGRSYSYCSSDNLKYLSCGTAMDIPYQLPGIISFAVTFLKVITPIILIFVSIISLLKALASSSEDEIKKAQNSLIKKMIAAALVFFVVTIVQFVIFKVAETNDKKGISACMSCFLNNDCSGNIYYKTNVSGQYVCKTLGGTIIKCKK